MENWGDESVPVTRQIDDRLDWLNLTGFVYLRLSQSSNVSKRLNCLSFQTCKCSSDCGKLFGGTAEVLSYVAVLLRQLSGSVVNAVANEVEETEFRDWNFSPNCSDLRPSRPRTFQK